MIQFPAFTRSTFWPYSRLTFEIGHFDVAKHLMAVQNRLMTLASRLRYTHPLDEKCPLIPDPPLLYLPRSVQESSDPETALRELYESQTLWPYMPTVQFMPRYPKTLPNIVSLTGHPIHDPLARLNRNNIPVQVTLHVHGLFHERCKNYIRVEPAVDCTKIQIMQFQSVDEQALWLSHSTVIRHYLPPNGLELYRLIAECCYQPPVKRSAQWQKTRQRNKDEKENARLLKEKHLLLGKTHYQKSRFPSMVHKSSSSLSSSVS